MHRRLANAVPSASPRPWMRQVYGSTAGHCGHGTSLYPHPYPLYTSSIYINSWPSGSRRYHHRPHSSLTLPASTIYIGSWTSRCDHYHPYNISIPSSNSSPSYPKCLYRRVVACGRITGIPSSPPTPTPLRRFLDGVRLLNHGVLRRRLPGSLTQPSNIGQHYHTSSPSPRLSVDLACPCSVLPNLSIHAITVSLRLEYRNPPLPLDRDFR